MLSAVSNSIPQTVEPERRDLWHEPWAFALVIGLLAAEWIVRRMWGCGRECGNAQTPTPKTQKRSNAKTQDARTPTKDAEMHKSWFQN